MEKYMRYKLWQKQKQYFVRCVDVKLVHMMASQQLKTVLCKKDNLLVVYDPLKDKATISRKVERASSSGKRFY